MKKEELMKKWNLAKGDLEQMLKFYDYLGFNYKLTEEDLLEKLDNDITHGYLTANLGADNCEYFYYYDGTIVAVLNQKTEKIIEDGKEIEKLFREEF